MKPFIPNQSVSFRRFLQAFFRTGHAHKVTARALANMLFFSLKLHPVALIAQLTGMVSLMALLWTQKVSLILGWIWFGSGVVLIYLALTFVRRFWLDRQRVGNIRRWVRRWTWLAVMSGLFWGIASPLMMTSLSGLHQVVTVAVVVAVTFASWPVYSCWLPSLTAFTLLSLTPLTITVASQYGVSATLLALVMFVVMGFILYSGRKLNEMLMNSIYNDTQNRRLVERLRVEITTAEQARRNAVADSERRSRFFAAANHDIRQPLQAMGIFLNILKGQVGPDLKPTVEQIARTGEEISTLVEQVLTVTRMEFGQLECHPEKFLAHTFLERLAAESRPIAEERGLTIRVVADKTLTAYTDPGMLARALKNLITNAIRYSRPDAARPEIVLSCRAHQGRLTFAVYDCGPGLTPEERTRLFDTFWRGSAAKTSRAGGYGLGLSIVKGLARQLGASVTIGSRLGSGSVFRFSLNIDESRQAEVLREESTEEATLESLRGTVLLVEDNPLVRSALQSLIESWGATVVSGAQLTSDVIEAGKAAGDDLIGLVSDYNLGEGLPTGVDVAQLLMNHLGRSTALVLITAVARDLIEADIRKRRLHFESTPQILQKPLDAEALNHALLIARRRSHRLYNLTKEGGE